MTQVEPFSPRRAHRRASEQSPDRAPEQPPNGYTQSPNGDSYDPNYPGSQPGPRPYTSEQPQQEQYPGQFSGRYTSQGEQTQPPANGRQQRPQQYGEQPNGRSQYAPPQSRPQQNGPQQNSQYPGQPQYGQAQYGQPPYGQPERQPNGQAQYGQPERQPNGQAQYGEQPNGRPQRRAQQPPPAYPGQGQLAAMSQQGYDEPPADPQQRPDRGYEPDYQRSYQPGQAFHGTMQIPPMPAGPAPIPAPMPAPMPAPPVPAPPVPAAAPPVGPPPGDEKRYRHSNPGSRRQAQERTRPRNPEPEPEVQDDRRGGHATPLGQGFSWVVLWTIAGAIIPGSGLIAAGRRRLGGFLLFLLALAGVGLVGATLMGNPISNAISLAVDPRKLLILAMVVVVGALLWAGVILLTNAQLRRYATLTSGQRSFSTLVVLALIAGVGLPAFQVSHYALIQRDLVNSVFKSGGDSSSGPKAGAADPWAHKPRENVLLIGSDAGADRTGIRPDTLILASINTKTGDTVLFSLPRNLERVPFADGSGGRQAWPNGFYCPTQGTGHDCLLNAVWQWGATTGKQYYAGAKNPGLEATEDAVEGVTGLKVDTYAMLNLKGFQDFIDAIGGLDLNVKERLPIGGNSEHPVATHGYIEPGKQKLNGFKSLWYARSRWSTNDYDRMRRQRCVIGAVVQQSDPVKIAKAFPSIAKAAKSNLSSGIPREDLEAWVKLTQKVQGASVRSLPFTDQVVADRANPDFAQIRELVSTALKPVKKATPDPSAGATTPTKKKKPVEEDPSKAQNITDVC